jgi:MFS superfamily sulfate permease-like transporter
MKEKDLPEYKRKYEISRHHAWAGTALLSLLLAFRYFITSIPDVVFIPIVSILAFYILIGLICTYKYRAGLSVGQRPDYTSEEVEKEAIRAEVEKKRIKLDKKRAKAEAKARKE